MDTNRKKIERWLRNQAFGEHDEPLTKIAIKHSAQGSKGTIVGEHRIEKLEPDEISECVNQLMQAITDDASGMGGVQRYILEAHHGDSEASSARCPVRVEGFDESIDGDSQDAEPPTKAGLTTQLMRHNEIQMKSFAGSVGATFATTQRIIVNQQNMIENLLAQRLKDFEAIEAAQSKRHEREMEMTMLVSEEDRKGKLAEQGIDTIKALAPAVINRLSGQKLLPEASPQMLMLKGFVETLSNEQLMAMAKNMEPHQQIAFFELLKTFQASDKPDKQESESNGKV